MSWSELERFVDDVEADSALQRALKHCRSRKELILAARRLGYRITTLQPCRLGLGGGAQNTKAPRSVLMQLSVWWSVGMARLLWSCLW